MLAPKRTGIKKFISLIMDFFVFTIDSIYVGISTFLHFGRQSDSYSKEELNFMTRQWQKLFDFKFCKKKLQNSRPNRPLYDGSGNSNSNNNDDDDDSNGFIPKQPMGVVRSSKPLTFRCGGGG